MVLFRRQIDSSLVNMSYCSRFYKMFSWKAGLRILDQHVIDSHVAFREFRFILVLNTCNMFSGIWFCNENNSNKKLVKCVFLGILFSMYRFFSPIVLPPVKYCEIYQCKFAACMVFVLYGLICCYSVDELACRNMKQLQIITFLLHSSHSTFSYYTSH